MSVTALLLPLLLACQNPPSFQVTASYVKVPVTVFDGQGRILVDLKREHFRLFDEGEPRTIENFILDRTPIHVILLLDVSGSVREELQEIRESALRFARSFHRQDRIAVISFSDRLEVIQNWTHRYSDLRRSLKKLEPGFRTALYDALLAARDKLQPVTGKKVIIVFTDGMDNESVAGFEDLAEPLIASSIALYVVSRTRLIASQVERSDRVAFLNRVMKKVLDDDENFVETYFREKEASLQNLAESTGGRAFFPEKLEELRDSYVQVARELKSQYLLTFEPPAVSDLKFRRIEVRCTRKVGRIYHRTKYHFN